jgi:glutathione synthase/RimK-type ligase-like ATP-grasp enzyme
MIKTLIVIDSHQAALANDFPNVISFDSYLASYPKLNEPRTRIINLCDTGRYLSEGYYCSLLAEARKHSVLPSVKTINALRHVNAEDDALLPYKSYLLEYHSTNQSEQHFIYFGVCQDTALAALARRLFKDFASPILQLTLHNVDGIWQPEVLQLGIHALNDAQLHEFETQLKQFTQQVWRVSAARKCFRWDMAILVDDDETLPPSNKEALTKFVKAAAKNGINGELVSKDQIRNIACYDALFIRETTAIDHHTYRLASKAERQGLVVIDDPVSILRCCNKVFLHDAFSYQNVPSLRTLVIHDASNETLSLLESEFGFPLVLKMPESSFSKGVFKVTDHSALQTKLTELLQQSALVLAQEFLFTDFDWRIGVLNGRAIYACRYEMARNHWQIYNHSSKRNSSGGFETLPTFEVPKPVLDAALNAAKLIGNGLYGVDVKEKDSKAFVLEVNDNPNIDHKVEDVYLRDELYMQIMSEFARRLELRGR